MGAVVQPVSRRRDDALAFFCGLSGHSVVQHRLFGGKYRGFQVPGASVRHLSNLNPLFYM